MKKEDRIKVWEKYGHHCAYCGKEIKFEDMQVDHFVPENRGGYPRWSDKEGKYVVSHGEYGTNNRLSSLEVQMRAEMEVVKDKFQRRLDRLIKRKSRA